MTPYPTKLIRFHRILRWLFGVRAVKRYRPSPEFLAHQQSKGI